MTWAGFLLLLAASAAACGSTAARSSTVAFASGADLESADPLVTVHPLSRQVQRFVLLVTLARLDSTLSPEPYLARRWTWSPDRRVLTMHLFAGLRWHDGTPTTARDAVFTIEAARDRATGYARASELASVEEASAPDDSTLLVRFRQPQPSLPLILSELPLVPEHILRDVPRAELRRHAFSTAPVGNGPFRFVSRAAGRRWVFERVNDFPPELGGPPGINRLVVAVVDEPTTKFAGLVSGDLDVAGIAPTMASLVDRDPSLRVISYPVGFSTTLVFNWRRPVFADVRVRRAIDGVINRQRIVNVALAGFGRPAQGAVNPDHPAAVAVPRLASAAADSLLDSAGWPKGADGWRERDGQRLAFTLTTVASGDNAIEQLLQADLRSHGIEVELRQVDPGAFLLLAREKPKRFDAIFTGIPTDLSLSHLSALFDGRAAGGALDYADWHTPRLDSLFERARTAPDDGARREAWRLLQEQFAADMPASWIYHARGVQGISRRLDGVRMDLRGEMVSVIAWRIVGAERLP